MILSGNKFKISVMCFQYKPKMLQYKTSMKQFYLKNSQTSILLVGIFNILYTPPANMHLPYFWSNFESVFSIFISLKRAHMFEHTVLDWISIFTNDGSQYCHTSANDVI